MSLKPLYEEGVNIEWKAWRMPEGAAPPAKPEGYGKQAKQYLDEFVQRTGLTIRHPSARRQTFLAHTGGKFAREKGAFEAYHLRVFRAVWEYDEDIEDTSVLCRIAEEAGLDPAAFAQALAEEKYQDMVKEDYRIADERKIWTIPSYLGEGGEIQVHHFQDVPSAEQLRFIM